MNFDKLIEYLIDFLNQLSPSLIEIKFADQFKAAERIILIVNSNININFDKSETSENNIVQAEIFTANSDEKSSSVLLKKEGQNGQVVVERNNPFNTGIQVSIGTHLIINNDAFWSKENFDKDKLFCEKIKLIPISPLTKEIEFSEIKQEDRFKAKLVDNELHKLCDIKRGKDIEVTDYDLKEGVKLGRSTWYFGKYFSGQVIQFSDIPETVLSFNEKVAEKAILILREHEKLPTEYYVLIFQVHKN